MPILRQGPGHRRDQPEECAGGFTGLRLGDAAKLSWEAVDLQKKTITVMPSKTRRKKRVVHIPIQPDLLAYLECAAVRDDSPAAPVFPALAKLKTDARKGLTIPTN